MSLRLRRLATYGADTSMCIVHPFPVAADQPLRAELEVLLPSLRLRELRHGLRGGAPAHQEDLLGHL